MFNKDSLKKVLSYLKALLFKEIYFKDIGVFLYSLRLEPGRQKSGLIGLLNFTKVTAVVVLACFITTSVCGDVLASLAKGKEEVKQFAKIFDDLSIPHTSGRLTKARYYGSDEVVINIQDLHCHAEVQKNISGIISLLTEKYKLPNIYIEGAIGKVDTSWLCSIKDKDLKKKITDSLIEQGKLTGSEYYSVTNDKPDFLLGLEDEAIYKGNLVRLNKIIQEKSSLDKIINDVESDLAPVRKRYYNAKQKSFEKLIQDYKVEKVNTKKYYAQLKEYSSKLNLDIYGYPNIMGFIELVSNEKELKYKKVARELQEFVILLKSKLPYSAYKILLENTDNFSKPDKLYLYLIKLSKDYNLDVSYRYPELSKFFDYVDKSQDINPLKLIYEEKKLTNEIYTRLATNQSEADIIFLVDFTKYLADYYRNKISQEDYNYFENNINEFTRLWTKYVGNNRLLSFKQNSEVFEQFYKANIERNNAFIKNSIGDIRNDFRPDISNEDQVEKTIESLKKATRIIVTVTGGFHTEGFAKLLDDRKITYLIITPNVTQDTKFAEQVYMKLAKEQSEILFQTLALLALSQQPLNFQLWQIAESRLAEIMQIKDMTPEKAVQMLNAELKKLPGEAKFRFEANQFVFDLDNKMLRFDYTAANKNVALASINNKPVVLQPGATEKAYREEEEGITPDQPLNPSQLKYMLETFTPAFEIYALAAALSDEGAKEKFLDAHVPQDKIEAETLAALEKLQLTGQALQDYIDTFVKEKRKQREVGLKYIEEEFLSNFPSASISKALTDESIDLERRLDLLKYAHRFWNQMVLKEGKTIFLAAIARYKQNNVTEKIESIAAVKADEWEDHDRANGASTGNIKDVNDPRYRSYQVNEALMQIVNGLAQENDLMRSVVDTVNEWRESDRKTGVNPSGLYPAGSEDDPVLMNTYLGHQYRQALNIITDKANEGLVGQLAQKLNEMLQLAQGSLDSTKKGRAEEKIKKEIAEAIEKAKERLVDQGIQKQADAARDALSGQADPDLANTVIPVNANDRLALQGLITAFQKAKAFGLESSMNEIDALFGRMYERYSPLQEGDILTKDKVDVVVAGIGDNQVPLGSDGFSYVYYAKEDKGFAPIDIAGYKLKARAKKQVEPELIQAISNAYIAIYEKAAGIKPELAPLADEIKALAGLLVFSARIDAT